MRLGRMHHLTEAVGRKVCGMCLDTAPLRVKGVPVTGWKVVAQVPVSWWMHMPSGQGERQMGRA